MPKYSFKNKVGTIGFFFQFNRWFSSYVIAAMLVDGKQKIAH